MILISGATGDIGGKVAYELLGRGQTVRALARDPRKAEGLARLGAEVVHGDFTQPESLRAALQGVEKVFLMTPSAPDQPDIQGRFARLAKEAGVAHVVRLSGARARPDHPARVYRWHHAAEEQIRRAGLALTTVRPVYFMQNFISFHLGQSIRMQGQWVGPMPPDLPFSLVDTRDIAAVAATCLIEPGHEGMEYDLTGPAPLSSSEQAARISAALGRPVAYVHMPPDEFMQRMTGSGMPRELALTVLEIHQHLDDFTSDVVERVTGRPPTSFDQFLRAHAAQLAPPRPLTVRDTRPPVVMPGDTPRSVLVTGATGRQGGAAARALVSAGHRVRALTRRPETRAAQALAALGVELAPGSFDDAASLARALEGMDAVFAISTPFDSPEGPLAEDRQGIALLEAAARAAVRHIVYTSAANADRDTGIPHFQSKRAVELRLATTGIPFTILAPASFMENLLVPMRLAALERGLLASPLSPSRKVAQISVEDIGRFAALVLSRPAHFAGRRIDLAADDVSGEEMAAILARTLGGPVRCVPMPPAAMRAQGETMLRALEFLENTGYSVDIAGLRRDYPEIDWLGFEAWARTLDRDAPPPPTP